MTTVKDILRGASTFNVEYAPYSWAVPLILFVTAAVFTTIVIKGRNKKTGTFFKLFLSVVYILSGISVWLSMKSIDMLTAASGLGILWFYALLFLLDAVWWKKIHFAVPVQKDLKYAMFFFILLGFFYPVIEIIFGYTWPGMVLFGSECPTTTFVIGLLIGSLPHTNKWILGILAANAVLVGGYAGFSGFIVDAVTYFPAGMLGWIMLIRYWKAAPQTSLISDTHFN